MGSADVGRSCWLLLLKFGCLHACEQSSSYTPLINLLTSPMWTFRVAFLLPDTNEQIFLPQATNTVLSNRCEGREFGLDVERKYSALGTCAKIDLASRHSIQHRTPAWFQGCSKFTASSAISKELTASMVRETFFRAQRC